MSKQRGHDASLRPNRGRPGAARGSARRRSAPTRTRLLALRVLDRTQRGGAYADVLLHAELGRSSLTAQDRAFATELVYGTLRWRGRIDFLLAQVLDRDLEKVEPPVANALRLGAYQLLFCDRIPAMAAVDEAVRSVRAAGAERATGFVNAVLRRLASECSNIALPDLEGDPLSHLTHALSLPPWIAARWLEQFGPEAAAALARASNAPPPLTVRANPRLGSAAELLVELRARFPDAVRCRLAPGGISLGRRGVPALDPAFLDGRFTVQDEAAQLVVDLLDPQPGERLLDACAAPGGKATAIAERIGESGQLVALDRNARRLDMIRRAARRLGLANIRCLERDASRSLADLASAAPFDRVLVDAPCSGLGTLRRNPDARWRIAPGDPARLAERQAAILASAASVLRPGGVLVYSTCTLVPEENEAIVESFLNDAKDFRLARRASAPQSVQSVIGEDLYLRCLPHLHDTDGFFAARLEHRR
jgi:16S rRNA (cytosine967-C5)-methyltransferase